MRKVKTSIITILTAIILSCCFTAFAAEDTEHKVGDVVGKVYETDIVADIDGMKIPSYNIGGETVIVFEDLKDYGFEVDWEPEMRFLSASVKEKPAAAPEYIPQKGKASGKIAGNIYHTDIRTFVNGSELRTYNIGGKTVVSIEELSCANKPEGIEYRTFVASIYSPLGYSVYMFKSHWNPDKRTISLGCIRPKMKINCNIGEVKIEAIKPYSYFAEFYDIYKGDEQVLKKDLEERMRDDFIGCICEHGIDGSINENLTFKGDYYDLEKLLSIFGLEYTFQDNTLNIIGEMNSKEWVMRFSGASNHIDSNNFLIVNIDIERNGKPVSFPDNEMICYIYNGNLFIRADVFTKAIGVEFTNNGIGKVLGS